MTSNTVDHSNSSFIEGIKHTHNFTKHPSFARLSRLCKVLHVAICLTLSLSTIAFAAPRVAAPDELTTTAISSSEIQLSWTDNSKDESGFRVERSLNPSGSFSVIATMGSGIITYHDSDLNADTAYSYRVRALGRRNSTPSNVSTVTTFAASTPPQSTPPPSVAVPAAPNGLSARSASANQINLGWTDNSDNKTGFKIERAFSYSGPWSQIATVAAGSMSYSDTGLNPSSFYAYRVRASNSASDSDYSNISGDTTQSASAPAPDPTPLPRPAPDPTPTPQPTVPVSPSGTTATVVSSSQIILSWTDNSADEDSFVVERAASASGPWSQAAIAAANTTTYLDTNLSAATSYYYRVRATNSVGDSTNSNTATATTQSPPPTTSTPAAPSGFGASKTSSSQINMWWTDNANDETGFKIERAFSYGGPWTQVATVGANVRSYSDTGLLPSTFYSYRVRATNAGGDSTYSNISGDTTLTGSTPIVTIPSAPSSAVATALSASQVALTWVDNSNNETGFKIERALSASGPWTQIATPGAGATSYTDSNLTAATLYYYRVRATNSAGDSGYSNQAATTTSAGAPSVPPSTPPSAPSGLSASAVSMSQINLGWVNNGGSESGFKLECALTASGPWTQFATTGAGATSYTHTGLLASTLYYYRVRAFNGSGDSGYSTVANAITLAASTTPPAGGSLSIPSSHPRLWWNSARLSQARSYYASHPFTPPSVSIGDDAFQNAVAYQMTGNASYARAAINWLMGYQIPAGQATPSAVGSDNARWDGENAVIVFDWCWDQMTASERSTVINNWNTWLGNINQQSWGGVGMEMNNYYWGNLRNSFEWGIATYGESSQAQSFIDNALTSRWKNSFIPFAATYGKGGVLQEGPGYGAVTAWYPMIPFTSCGLLGRNVWNESPFFKETVMYMVYATTPAATSRKGDSAVTYELFPFNDSEYPQNGSIFNIRKYYGDFMNVVANQWSSTGVGQYARRWVNMTQPSTSWHVAAVDNGGSEQSFNNLPLDYFASGTSYLYARNVWGATSTAVNFLMGNPTGVGHAHRDIGSFQIWRNGRWVSRNTGGYSNSIIGYGGGSTDVSSPSAHNVVLINGVGQLADSWAKGDPTMLRLEDKPAYVYAAVDLTSIYKANSDFAGRVPEAPINSYIREYVFVRSTETLYVCDRIDAGSGSVTATFLLHSEQSNPLFSSTAKVGSPSATRTVDEGVSGVGQYRFEYDYPISGKGYFVRAISPSGVSDNSVVFNANGVGGTFNGTAFGTGIATCTVTDNGPVWNP